MIWNKEEYLDDFNKRFESGELADSVFDFLDDYLPQFFNKNENIKNGREIDDC